MNLPNIGVTNVFYDPQINSIPNINISLSSYEYLCLTLNITYSNMKRPNPWFLAIFVLILSLVVYTIICPPARKTFLDAWGML